MPSKVSHAVLIITFALCIFSSGGCGQPAALSLKHCPLEGEWTSVGGGGGDGRAGAPVERQLVTVAWKTSDVS